MRNISEWIKSLCNYVSGHPLETIYFAGILLRGIVFIFLDPSASDAHVEVVKYIYQYHRIPLSEQFNMSFHPPLYYLLASLFYFNIDKLAQGLSLIFSFGTLTLIYWMIKEEVLFRSDKARNYCLLLAAFLPSFIMFGMYLSNDSLSFFLGALIYFQAFRYLRKPSLSRLSMLALYLGLGLLTKGTFLIFIPVLVLLVIFVNLRKNAAIKKHLVYLLVFISISLGIGSYKYIENVVYFGRPVVHNLDRNPEWADLHKPTYNGLKSIYDANLVKLCRYPTVSIHTKRSYPLLLYGTFWYQYVVESNFLGNQIGLKYLGSFIYIFGLFAALLFIIGLLRIVNSFRDILRYQSLDEPGFNKAVFEWTALIVLLLNLILVIGLGVKYDVWSCFQSRLMFPAFFSFIVLFNSGLEYAQRWPPLAKKALYNSLKCLFFLCVFYFISEASLLLIKKAPIIFQVLSGR